MSENPVDSMDGGEGGQGGGGSGLGSALSSLTGVMKGMGGSIGKSMAGGPIGMALTAVVKIGETIIQIMTKIMNLIIDSSPMLQGVLKIVDRMFKLVLMPVGNMIARMLLPMAIKMASKTISVLGKYANATPDKMMDAATDGFSVMIDSMVEMIGTVLFKVLPPIMMGLGKAIARAITNALGFTSGEGSDYKNEKSPFGDISADFKTLLGGSTMGASSAIDQFGLTVLTGNKLVQGSTGELATVMYAGSASIEDGFQSTHRVLAIGTTGALNSLNDYNIANAGLVTTIDTTTMKFSELIDVLEQFRTVVDDGNKENGGGGEGGKKKKTGWKWWQWAALAMAPTYALPYMAATKEPFGGKEGGYYPGKMPKFASGGIITRPTYGLIGEAGPEAVIPLNRSGGVGGNSIHVHFHGDVYGIPEFEKKVEQTVNKYSGRLRGAY